MSENSTHKVEVVPVRLEKHPNADRLSVVKVFGYQVCSGTEDWLRRPAIDEQGTRLGAYVPPDSLVKVSRPEFDFLAPEAKDDGFYRVKAKKLRGVVSFGLLVPAPPGSKVGDDVTALLEVEHYVPPEPGQAGKKGLFLGGEDEGGPSGLDAPKYDLEAFRRYHEVFTPCERVVLTEKLDGTSARYVYQDGRMYCGSRTNWKKQYPDYSHLTKESLVEKGFAPERAEEILDRLHNKPAKLNVWWEVLSRTPSLEKFCRENPGVVVYGEVFGATNCIKYGLPDVNRFAGFDLRRGGEWLDAVLALDMAYGAGLPWVPLIAGTGGCFSHPYSFDAVCSLAEGTTLVADAKEGTLREGVVVKPAFERHDPRVGRVALKAVGAAFLEKYR